MFWIQYVSTVLTTVCLGSVVRYNKYSFLLGHQTLLGSIHADALLTFGHYSGTNLASALLLPICSVRNFPPPSVNGTRDDKHFRQFVLLRLFPDMRRKLEQSSELSQPCFNSVIPIETVKNENQVFLKSRSDIGSPPSFLVFVLFYHGAPSNVTCASENT